MSAIAQIIVAAGFACALLLFGMVGVIWSIRCDPKRPHYRLPALAAFVGPIGVAIAALLKLH
jgi:uncharacterized membrane protein YciS (DUF1049 family)